MLPPPAASAAAQGIGNQSKKATAGRRAWEWYDSRSPSDPGTKAMAVDPTISSLITSAERGDPAATEALFTALYDELHRVAKRELARHGWGVSLGATSLLHEAYLDLSRRESVQFPDRNRFMAYAARVMRGLIIDYVRNRQAQKRGGQFELTTISTDVAAAVASERELIEVSDALDELAKTDPLLAEVVDLKFFCGFSFAEIATIKGVSERTVQRSWQKARIYLHRAVRSTISPV
jgi:RNA polymerase sigma factor (TIGR02999 family)